MSTPRVRFAPSPTGPLHIGGLRTALYNYLFARKLGGSFILRIEDTDQKRYVEGAEQYIREALNWSGMTPDEGPEAGGDFGPYRQSERSALYAKYTQRLIDSGRAYYAFDTPEALDAARSSAEADGKVFRYDASTRGPLDNSLKMSADALSSRLDTDEPRVVRLLVQPDETVIFEDVVRGTVRMSTNELDDKVLMKADGLPTYHLANVVDDYEMKITHVIRGEEWLPSTAHHVLLYDAFGFRQNMPAFAHLPLILKPVGKGKLSKRDGAKFGMPVFPMEWDDKASGETFSGFRESGFLPDAVINFLAFLGWNPGTEQEMFKLEDLVEAFSLEKIGKSGARFDFDKAKWFNQQYIAQLNNDAFADMVTTSVEQAGFDVSRETLLAIAPLMRERLTTADELPTIGAYLFESPTAFDEKQAIKRLKKADLDQLANVRDVLQAVSNWTGEDASTSLKSWANENDVKLGILLPLYRIALTGGMSGPDVFDLGEVLGKEETIQRWETALAHFRSLKSNLGEA